MEKILMIGCKKLMDDVCIACSRCMVAFNRREGTFARYKDQAAEMLGFLHCGDCPGVGVVNRMAQFKLWNTSLGEKPTKIHLGTCLVNYCPEKEHLVANIKAKAGVEVIEGGHAYIPTDIFK
jgi:predicted metal-binding protein